MKNFLKLRDRAAGGKGFPGLNEAGGGKIFRRSVRNRAAGGKDFPELKKPEAERIFRFLGL